MLSHEDIWLAIDRLAKDHGLSPSGLARRAGLDPTTFNKSKRITRDGKRRWPSTESISKILHATESSLKAFVAFVGDGEREDLSRNIPMIGLVRAGGEGVFDGDGRVLGTQWDEIPFPDMSDAHAYGLEISGSSLEPAYRDGDVLVVSPQADIRRGDRVIVRTRQGEMLVSVLVRRTARRVELSTLDRTPSERVVTTEDLDWIARIVWVSQ